MSARLANRVVPNSGARVNPARRIPIRQIGLVCPMAVLRRLDIDDKVQVQCVRSLERKMMLYKHVRFFALYASGSPVWIRIAPETSRSAKGRPGFRKFKNVLSLSFSAPSSALFETSQIKLRKRIITTEAYCVDHGGCAQSLLITSARQIRLMLKKPKPHRRT